MNYRMFGRRLFRVALCAAASLCLGLSSAHAVVLYASTGDLNIDGGGRIYAIDPNTQSVTLVGNTGLSRTSGLEFNENGVLYVVGFGLGPVSLYTINTTNGAATLVGAVTGTTGVGGLAFDSSGTLYGGGFMGGQGVLLTIDPGSGSSLTSIAMTGSGNRFAAGLAFNDLDVLYGSRGGSFRAENFITIDPATGVQTAIDPLNATTFGMNGAISDIWFAPDGTLYGASPTGVLYEVDPLTGAKTLLFNTVIRISGLTGAPEVAAVSEPLTLALLSVGVLGFGVARRRLSRR